MKTVALYIILSFSLWACAVDYTLDSRQSKKNLVVDGLVTTLPDSSRIILAYTSGNFQTGSTDYVNNATVTVSDETGKVVTFTPASKKGKYTASSGYAATPGRKYHLKVVSADGTSYEVDDDLLPVAPIKKIDFIKNTPIIPEPLNTKSYQYQVRFYVQKAAGRNYFKIVQYRNGKEYNTNNNATVHGDEVLEDKTNILSAQNRYKENDVARIDLLSISERVYQFYTDLNNVQNNDGGMFTAPAANPVSNISGGAMGVFQASDDSFMETKISP